LPYSKDHNFKDVVLDIADAPEIARRNVPKGYLTGYYSFVEGKLYRQDLACYTRLNYVREALVDYYSDEIHFLKGITLVDSQVLSRRSILEKNIWNIVKRRRLDKTIVKVLREGYEESIEGITFLPTGEGRAQLGVELSNAAIRIDDLGDGTRIAADIMAMMSITRDSCMLLEDPEVHQHPGGLYRLTEAILKMSKENNVQLIVTTHSIELLKMASEIAKDLSIEVSFFFVERNEKGIVNVRRFDKVDMDVLEKIGLDPRFMYLI